MKRFKSLRIACSNLSIREEVVALLSDGRQLDSSIDLKWGFRRIPLSYGNHHGGYVCAFRGQPLLRVESALERRILRALAAESACLALVTQPVTFEWKWRETQRRYTPDILAILHNPSERWRAAGLRERSLIEVKPQRFAVDDDLWMERVRIVKRALNMPLVRLTEVIV